jgi:sterol 24-C-methyltransferase
MTQTLLDTPRHPGRSERGSESDSSLDEIVNLFRGQVGQVSECRPETLPPLRGCRIVEVLSIKQMTESLGPNYQEKVGDCLKSYYGVLNHLCALGFVGPVEVIDDVRCHEIVNLFRGQVGQVSECRPETELSRKSR